MEKDTVRKINELMIDGHRIPSPLAEKFLKDLELRIKYARSEQLIVHEEWGYGSSTYKYELEGDETIFSFVRGGYSLVELRGKPVIFESESPDLMNRINHAFQSLVLQGMQHFTLNPSKWIRTYRD